MEICSKVIFNNCVIPIGNSTMFSASYLPTILVYTIGWIFPAVAIAFFFLYIEREDAPTE